MKTYDSNGNLVDEFTLTGSNAAQSYTQLSVTTAQTITLEPGASNIEIYVESGNVRVRTDGNAATNTIGEPIGEGHFGKYTVASLSIISPNGGTSVVQVVQR